jgi:hypothetical protein
VQREEIMKKIVEVHDILQQVQINTSHHPINIKRTGNISAGRARRNCGDSSSKQ